jgi:hypothetical protein
MPSKDCSNLHDAMNHVRTKEIAMLIRIALTLALGLGLGAGTLCGEAPKPIPPEQFARLHKMIRVQPDEQRFWQIPWKLRISEARQQAAKEGKPIFVWAGAGGAPIGVC